MAHTIRNEANLYNGVVHNVNNPNMNTVNNAYNVNGVNNNVNNVQNTQRLDTLLHSLPQQPLLLQAPQVYDHHRAVRRPHWQQQISAPYTQQQINNFTYPQSTPQQLYPQFQHSLPQHSLPQPAGHQVQFQLPPEQLSAPSYYPHPNTPQTSTYSPQLDEINLENDEEHEVQEDPSSEKSKKEKKKRGLRRRKHKDDANQIGIPEEALGMQVKTPAQLGKYVSVVLNSLGTPNLGIYLTVNKLNYYVNTKENAQKHILKDISFYLKPGMMCLVLGNPGGGRSSLFKVLSNVTPPKSKVDGQVLFNNNPINPKTHHRNISYITQNDNHMPTLTVRETLWFSSECILPENINRASKEHRLDILLNILGLTGCQDTLVGNEFIRGVSGGQKKRVTIGLDMMKGASLYFMDEPTTGLDSVTSLEVLSCVKSLALSSHVGVLISLLQPPKEVYDLFDYVLLLNGGEVSYFGTTESALPYFENLGMKKPDVMNPAEFLQEVVVVPDDFAVDPENNEYKCPDDFARLWRNSPECEEVMDIVSNPTAFIPDEVINVLPSTQCGGKSSKKANETYIVPFRKQLELCMWRSYKMTRRNYISIFSRVFNLLVVALILGTLFVNLDNDQQSIAQREGLVYFAFLTILFSSFVTIRDLYDQRPIFYEQRDQRKWYTTLPYFIAYITPELVIGISCVVLFSVTLYWLVDLNTADVRFLYFLLNLFLAELFGASFLIAVSAVTSSSLYAGVIVPSVLMLFILASGFTIPGNQIPGWWIWLYWASPVRWVYEGLLINEFDGQTFRCKAGQSYPLSDNPVPGFNGQPYCPLTTGHEVIASQGFNTHLWWRWIDLSVLIAFCVLCFAIAFIALKFIRLEPAAAVVISNKQNKDKKAKQEKTDTVVDIARSQDGNPLAIQGCYLVFKHLSYFVRGKKKKDSDGETPLTDSLDAQGNHIDAQGNKMMGSTNASTHKPEATQGDEIRLLNDISGYAKPGCLLALMGPSGAGKSTLLDVLADRKNAGRITGEITFDGKPRDKNFTRYAAYVTQTDVLFPTSTVREAITFSAKCRLPEQVSDEEKLAFVDSIIDDLRLAPIANNAIGSLGSGLTLEQRKRVNIAVELAANPQLLFLDEPTSGLDSAGARKVMKYVKNLSRQGRTIICTIHQPSSEIFGMFDMLLLLTQHGESVYFGDIGENGNALLSYASKYGYYMERERNPADFALEFSTATNRIALAKEIEVPDKAVRKVEEEEPDLEGDTLSLSPDTPKPNQPATPITPLSNAPESPYIEPSSSAARKREREEEREGEEEERREVYVEKVEELVNGYYQSEQYSEALQEMDTIQPQGFKPISYTGNYATGAWVQVRENMKRSIISAVKRRRAEFMFIVAQNAFLGVFLGTIFLKLGSDQDSVRNRVSLIFFSTNFAGFIGFSQIAPVAQERGVFYHEQAAGSYRPFAYGLALVASQIPVALCAVLGYSIPAYWIPDLEPRHDWHRFLFFIFLYFLAALVFIAFSVLLAVAMPNEGIAVMILGVVIPVFTLFGGFLIPRTQIPGWWIWAYWLSAIHYPVEALELNTLGGLTFHCKPDQFVSLTNGDGSIIQYCPITSASQVFNQYSLLTNWKWIDVGVLAGSYFIFVILIFISLAKVRWEKT